jgi:hypothetical protein
MAKDSQQHLTDTEIARRRDEAIKRALRTPPVRLEDLKKKRKLKTGASPKRKGD